MAKFQWLTGDVNWLDFGGKWYRRIDAQRFHILEFDSWAEDGAFKYYVTLSEIDLGALTDETRADVMSYADISDDDSPLAIVDGCHSYGAVKEVLLDRSGNNSRALISAAKRYSYTAEPNS